MTQKELEQKVIDAEGRVAKREAVLKKHNSQLAKMIEKGADRFDISIKREDIKSATCKLAEARETLANWQDKLNTRDAYLEANTPEILKDVLENWKQHAIGYYRQKRIRFIEYREGLKAKERAARLEALQTLPSLEKYRELYKGRELTDYDLANLWPRRDVDAFLSERRLEYHQIQKKLREAGDQITLRLLEIHNEDEREAWLEKTMEEEKRAKLLDLIGRIMSTVGTITDAAALYIGPEGDIISPDLNTTSQTMAWIMDTYSVNVGHTTLGVVTGKLISRELKDKLGIGSDTVRTNANADAWSADAPFMAQPPPENSAARMASTHWRRTALPGK